MRYNCLVDMSKKGYSTKSGREVTLPHRFDDFVVEGAVGRTATTSHNVENTQPTVVSLPQAETEASSEDLAYFQQKLKEQTIVKLQNRLVYLMTQRRRRTDIRECLDRLKTNIREFVNLSQQWNCSNDERKDRTKWVFEIEENCHVVIDSCKAQD